MGFNVQGIACSLTGSDAASLAAAMGLGPIEKAGDAYFEEASSSRIGERDFYITQLEKGTLVMMGDGFDVQDIPLGAISANGSALRFIVSETSMAFAFEYAAAGNSIRSVFHVNGGHLSEEGDAMEEEKEEDDMTNLIFGLVEKVTGTNFYSIDPAHPATHYRIL